MANWIIEHFPKHRIYVEPFGGSAGVLLNKRRSNIEVYNDLNDDVVDFFKILRSERCDELIKVMALTPYSRTELKRCSSGSADPIEKARRFLARSFMSISTDGDPKSGFRSAVKFPSMAMDWRNYSVRMEVVKERLQGVIIENRDALTVMRTYDTKETLHYVDPPYMPSTRSKAGRKYKYELTIDQHEELLHFLTELKGKVMVSGYEHSLYDSKLSDWHRFAKGELTNTKKKRIEVIWCNYQPEGMLF